MTAADGCLATNSFSSCYPTVPGPSGLQNGRTVPAQPCGPLMATQSQRRSCGCCALIFRGSTGLGRYSSTRDWALPLIPRCLAFHCHDTWGSSLGQDPLPTPPPHSHSNPNPNLLWTRPWRSLAACPQPWHNSLAHRLMSHGGTSGLPHSSHGVPRMPMGADLKAGWGSRQG